MKEDLDDLAICNISAICRICLQETEEEMISIYDKDVEENLCIYEKIEKCAQIKISKDAELPMRICKKCNVFLSFAFKFYIMCQNSNNYLFEYVVKSTDFEEEIEYDDAEYLVEELEDDSKEQEYFDEEENGIESDDNNGKITKTKRMQKKAMQKTLGITSDGEAIIQVNNAKLKKEKQNENQTHVCEICGNVYPKKYALDAHMRRHRNERNFECEICQQKFGFNFQLRRHIIKHSGARPYSCVYCQRTFTDSSTMRKHERLHRNERPYKCEVCEKTFTYSSVLKVHKQTHTGEKPFNCGLCGKKFSRAHHLRSHLETLLHSKDPQSKILLTQIRREEGTYEEDA